MLERQRRLNFLPEILFQATTKCDNSIAGPSKKKHGILGGDDLKTTITQRKQRDLTENKAIINELTSGAPLGNEIFTQ